MTKLNNFCAPSPLLPCPVLDNSDVSIIIKDLLDISIHIKDLQRLGDLLEIRTLKHRDKVDSQHSPAHLLLQI